MEVKVKKQNGGHVFTMTTNFEKIIFDNIEMVFDILKEKKAILDELVSVLSKDKAIEDIVRIARESVGVEKAANSLSAKFGIGTQTANYILDLPLEQLSDLNLDKVNGMKKELDDQIKKLI
jgi:Type IIA topoisomerase (DNA gyrase/topo II, topoisomerase IV), A subunit